MVVLEMTTIEELKKRVSSLDNNRYDCYYSEDTIIMRPNVSSRNLDTFVLNYTNSTKIAEFVTWFSVSKSFKIKRISYEEEKVR